MLPNTMLPNKNDPIQSLGYKFLSAILAEPKIPIHPHIKGGESQVIHRRTKEDGKIKNKFDNFPTHRHGKKTPNSIILMRYEIFIFSQGIVVVGPNCID